MQRKSESVGLVFTAIELVVCSSDEHMWLTLANDSQRVDDSKGTEEIEIRSRIKRRCGGAVAVGEEDAPGA